MTYIGTVQTKDHFECPPCFKEESTRQLLEPQNMSTEDNPRRLYIAGPMSGLPEFNYPAFNGMARFFRNEGYHVENPAENTLPPDFDGDKWQAYMRLSLRQLLTCDVVAALPGWEQSKRATIEVHLARSLGIPCFDAYLLRRVFTENPDAEIESISEEEMVLMVSHNPQKQEISE